MEISTCRFSVNGTCRSILRLDARGSRQPITPRASPGRSGKTWVRVQFLAHFPGANGCGFAEESYSDPGYSKCCRHLDHNRTQRAGRLRGETYDQPADFASVIRMRTPSSASETAFNAPTRLRCAITCSLIPPAVANFSARIEKGSAG